MAASGRGGVGCSDVGFVLNHGVCQDGARARAKGCRWCSAVLSVLDPRPQFEQEQHERPKAEERRQASAQAGQAPVMANRRI